MEMSRYRQWAVRRPLNPFPATIECVLDHYPPGGGVSLSFQKGVPFLWPLFVWFDIAQLRVARHANMDAFAISNSEGRRDHRGLERRLFRAVDAAKPHAIEVHDPANRRLDDVVGQVSHQPSDLRTRANRPRRRARTPSRRRRPHPENLTPVPVHKSSR